MAPSDSRPKPPTDTDLHLSGRTPLRRLRGSASTAAELHGFVQNAAVGRFDGSSIAGRYTASPA